MLHLCRIVRQVLAPPVRQVGKDGKKDKKQGIDQLMKESFGVQRVTASDKVGQNFIEYAAEYSTVANDGHRKKQVDVERERQYALGSERFLQRTDIQWDSILKKSILRQNEALDSLPQEFLGEATALNTQPYPVNVRPPKLTPPIFGYEPAYGMDVPQLRGDITEYPQQEPNLSDTDGQDSGKARQLVVEIIEKWSDALGQLRSAYPYTGPEGEQFEMYCYLNIRAFKRQLLLLDIGDDPEGFGKAMQNADFAARERAKRGILPLEIQAERNVIADGPPTLHESQSPQYVPFRHI